jgi:hypothetical protein
MTSSTDDNSITRKKRPDQTGELVGVRFQPKPLAAIDVWRRRQEDLPGRAEAIRRLVERALDAEAPAPRARTKGSDTAAKMAAHEINKLGDQTATVEERAHRKRRLIKGPRGAR